MADQNRLAHIGRNFPEVSLVAICSGPKLRQPWICIPRIGHGLSPEIGFASLGFDCGL
jgi:hypothetical protein